MGVSMEYMQDYVIKAYPGENWKLRVQMMEPRQVAAIYHSIRNKKSKTKKRRENRPLSLLPPDPYGNYEQMTIFDYIGRD